MTITAPDLSTRTSRDLAERASRIFARAGQPPVRDIDITEGDRAVMVVARYSLTEREIQLLRLGKVRDVRGLREGFRALVETELTRAVELVSSRAVVGFTSDTPEGSDLTVDSFVLADDGDRTFTTGAPAKNAPLPRSRPSDRELEVLQRAADGARMVDVAAQLFVSPSTVKTHFEHIYSKLGAHDRAHAVTIALRAGWIH